MSQAGPSYSQFPHLQSQFQSQYQTQGSQRALPRCLQCGSKRWRRDANRGAIICEEGHVLEGYVRESNEMTDPSQHQVRKRRLKGPKREKKQRPRRDYYHGERARFILLQALTMMLSRQVHALTADLSAGPELEKVAKTLWRIYVDSLSLDPDSLVPDLPLPLSDLPPPDTSQIPPLATASNVLKDPSVGEDDEAKWGAQPQERSARERMQELVDDPLSSSSSSSSSDPNDAASSDSDTASSASGKSKSSDGRSASSRGKKKKAKRRHFREIDPRIHIRAEFTLCVLYLSCTILKIPIMMHDICRMAANKKLPYLRFYYALPENMREKLNPAAILILFPEEAPAVHTTSYDSFTYWTSKLLGLFRLRAPEIFPSPDPGVGPNVPWFLWRFIEALLLPPEMFLFVNRLIDLLPPHLFLLHPLDPKPNRTGRPNKASSGPAEFSVMAAVVVGCKIVFGLDEEDLGADRLQNGEGKGRWKGQRAKRLERSLPEYRKWLQALEKAEEVVDPYDPRRLWEMELTAMTNKDVDDYIDFCEEALSKDEKVPSDLAFRKRMFPAMQRSSEPQHSAAARLTFGSLYASLYQPSASADHEAPNTTPPDSSSDEDDPSGASPLGSNYRVYSTTDVLGSLPSPFKTVLHRASEFVGATEESLLRVVIQLEHKLRQVESRLKKEAKAKGEEEGKGKKRMDQADLEMEEAKDTSA